MWSYQEPVLPPPPLAITHGYMSSLSSPEEMTLRMTLWYKFSFKKAKRIMDGVLVQYKPHCQEKTMSCYCQLIEVKAIAMYKISLSILIKNLLTKLMTIMCAE